VDAALLDSWVSAAHRARTVPLDTVAAFNVARADALRVQTSPYVTMPASGGTPDATFDTFNAARLAAYRGTGPVAANPVISRYVAAAA
jgi:hypothetical protein